MLKRCLIHGHHEPVTKVKSLALPERKLKNLACKGSFNNYVYQILPNFDPLPTFYKLSTVCDVTPMNFLLAPSQPPPPLLIHVVIGCPLTSFHCCSALMPCNIQLALLEICLLFCFLFDIYVKSVGKSG